eukprot:gene5394-biopygen13135
MLNEAHRRKNPFCVGGCAVGAPRAPAKPADTARTVPQSHVHETEKLGTHRTQYIHTKVIGILSTNP